METTALAELHFEQALFDFIGFRRCQSQPPWMSRKRPFRTVLLG
jgi:hypothetical protein